MAKLWDKEVREAAATAAASNATLEFSSDPVINQKVKEAITGLQPYIYKKFKNFKTENDKRLLAEFILVGQREQSINKLSTKKWIVYYNSRLLEHFNYQKSFLEITSQDFAAFLNKLSYVKDADGNCIKNPDGTLQFRDRTIDPDQKWINSHNTYAHPITKFYRWIHRPDLSHKARKRLRGEELPEVLRGNPNLWIEKRGPKTSVKPEDLWYVEEDAIFLKHCKDHPRLRFYHALAIDTGARPGELLALKIKHIKIERSNDGKFYVRLTVGRYGKMEESRTVPMRHSIKYYRAYLPHHPQGGEPGPEDFVFASAEYSARDKPSVPISEQQVAHDYRSFRKDTIPKLLKRPDISQQDKEQLIRLKETKKWKPYNMRHSGITRMARNPNIKESDLVKVGGWRNSDMLQQIYKNTSQDEVFEDVMLGLGVDIRATDKKQRQKMADEQLRGVFCGKCGMENVRDAQFCSECDWILPDKVEAKIKEEEERVKEFERTKQELAEFKAQKVEFEEFKVQFNEVKAQVREWAGLDKNLDNRRRQLDADNNNTSKIEETYERAYENANFQTKGIKNSKKRSEERLALAMALPEAEAKLDRKELWEEQGEQAMKIYDIHENMQRIDQREKKRKKKEEEKRKE